MVNLNAPTMGTYGSTWQVRGFAGSGLVGDLIDCLQGRPVAVCGSATGVFWEMDIVRKRYGEDLVVFAVNDVGMYLDRVDHWCSLHTENLKAWKAVRWLHHTGDDNIVYHGVDKGVAHNWQSLTPLFALSGYFAMQIAYIMGAKRIILCGCSGDSRARFFESQYRTGFGYGGGETQSDINIRQQLISEMNRLPAFKRKVRSMSGWTKSYFGREDD